MTKTFSFLEKVLTRLPTSDVDWLNQNYVFPENLNEDLNPEDRKRLDMKLSSFSSCNFPEFVSKSLNENKGFVAKTDSNFVLDLGGKC